MSRTTRILATTTAAAALLTGCASLGATGASSPTTTDAETAVVVATTASIGQAITDWYNTTGKTRIDAIQADNTAIGTDSSNADTAALANDCAQLGVDATKAQGDPAIPDAQAQASWASALGHLRQGGVDCTAGATVQDANQLTKGATEIGQGTTDITALSARLATLQGQ